jgi:hypothetical protein
LNSNKIYLEPRKTFDAFIISETEKTCTYCVQKILDCLSQDFSKETFDYSQYDFSFMVYEYFEYNIQSLQKYYSIEFDFTAYENN